MMDADQLGEWMAEHFTRAAFRLETLQVYEVASDGSDYRRYLDGEATWTPQRKQPWLDHLAAERARGLLRSRVRIVTHPISDYTRYECEWGYAPNVAAGEDVRILDVDEHDPPADLTLTDQDWWLVTDADKIGHMVVMRYGPDGRFDGAEEAPRATVAEAQAVRERLWSTAEPFDSWWRRHRELHRDHATAG